jgi:hypothetical protein
VRIDVEQALTNLKPKESCETNMSYEQRALSPIYS